MCLITALGFLGSMVEGREASAIFVCACVPVGWTGELALGIYFHECLECGQLWVGLSSPCFMGLNSWSLNHHSLFLKLFIFGRSGSSLLCGLFSSCGKQGLLSSCGVWASHCSGFSCCAAWAHGLQQLQPPGSRATQKWWHTGLAALWHVGSSRTRDQTHVSCTGRQNLHHRATREAQLPLF